MAYAAGKYALGECDYCGLTYKLKKLREVVRNLSPTGLLVCPECWEPDHPQNHVGRYPVVDPQTLERPRPDKSLGTSGPYSSRRIQWGWNPVGLHNSLGLTGLDNDLVPTVDVGTVTASAS